MPVLARQVATQIGLSRVRLRDRNSVASRGSQRYHRAESKDEG